MFFLNTLARVKPIIHDVVISPLLWLPAYLFTTYGDDYVKLVHVLEINSSAPDAQRHKHLQDAAWFIPFHHLENSTNILLPSQSQQDNQTKTHFCSQSCWLGVEICAAPPTALHRLCKAASQRKHKTVQTDFYTATFFKSCKGNILSPSRSFCQKHSSQNKMPKAKSLRHFLCKTVWQSQGENMVEFSKIQIVTIWYWDCLPRTIPWRLDKWTESS